MNILWGQRHKAPFKIILALLIVTLPLTVHALPEQELRSSFAFKIQPFFDEHFLLGTFQGVGNVTIHYAKREIPNPQGTLLLVVGRTEFLSKYAELLYDLRDLPFSYYLFDPRGQGASDRLLPDHDKGHVDSFDDYVSDLSVFISTVIKTPHIQKTNSTQHPAPPLFMLTHSMGGTVAALYANKHPNVVQGLILCAPMLSINTKPFPLPLAKLLSHTASLLGCSTFYVPNGKAYDPLTSFHDNKVTHSQVRFRLNQTLVSTVPINSLGSPTYGWMDHAFAAMQRLTTEHRQLTMPILLLQAGDDTVVNNNPQSAFCADLPRCTLVNLPGARHEILMEEDRIRDQALTFIRIFLTQNTAGRLEQERSHPPSAKDTRYEP
ncbi:MAG: alpha/beta fold hydrolase [Desulfobulbaceae bacterium]|nr:alpha/beta fold hydrolase [Desulfobulbaceae bacterium]